MQSKVRIIHIEVIARWEKLNKPTLLVKSFHTEVFYANWRLYMNAAQSVNGAYLGSPAPGGPKCLCETAFS